MINRTRAFLNDLSEKGEQIMIPSPVVLESLLTLSDEEMQKQRAILQSRFFIPSFDLPASVEAASLLNNREVIQKIERWRRAEGTLKDRCPNREYCNCQWGGENHLP